MRCLLVIVAIAFATPLLAAGSGAGAGGAGHQCAINSGLPAGEAGPPGSPNNPRPAPKQRHGFRSGMRSEVPTAR